jgi:hypothetical protein
MFIEHKTKISTYCFLSRRARHDPVKAMLDPNRVEGAASGDYIIQRHKPVQVLNEPDHLDCI